MSFKALVAVCSAERNTLCNFWILFGVEKKHLCNFGRGHYGEHLLHVKSF